ncbi:MAG: hypothetical protein FWF12_04575 [Betaproteobacteria bacterium]|nr:hypothetical protein [Betaproteobacteria bacterium]
MKQDPESLASQALSAVEDSRIEMLRGAARTLLRWDLSTEVIMEITGLSKENIDSLRGSKTDAPR